MSQYSTGLSSVTNNSPIVTGINTLWLANVTAGDSFTVAGDRVMYDVASVDSDTQVTLSAPYAGTTASGVVYAIGTGFTVPDSFPEMSQGDIETATIFTRAMRKIQSKFSGIVSDISGKAAIAGQTFTGDIAAPKITASTGVLFGTDTAAANTLDDYEEGTWTPTIANEVNASSVSIDESNYTKIGNMLYGQIRGTFSVSATGADTSFTFTTPILQISSTTPVGGGGVVRGPSGDGVNPGIGNVTSGDSDRVFFVLTSIETGSHSFGITFMHRVA